MNTRSEKILPHTTNYKELSMNNTLTQTVDSIERGVDVC